MTRGDGRPSTGAVPGANPAGVAHGPVTGEPTPACPRAHSAVPPGVPTRENPPGAVGARQPAAGGYGRGVRTASVLALGASAVLVAVAFTVQAAGGWRSAMFGVGLVGLSSAASVLVAAHMFRVAPAATAPALALLYLVKVLALGWLLVVPGAPPWLVPGMFLGGALGTHLIATGGFVHLTRNVSRREAETRDRAAAGSTTAEVAEPQPHEHGAEPARPASRPPAAP